jgi:TonB family protein
MRKLVLLFLPLALFGQNPPDARALLARADASLFTARTVRLAATQGRAFVNVEPPLANPFELEFVRGGRGRAEFRAGNTIITLMVFDGANLWEYHNLGNQYTKKSATAWTFQGEISTIDYGRKPNNISAASYESDETVTFKGLPVACYVVRAEYRGAPNNALGRGVVRRVWISKDGELILRDYWEGALTPGMAPARETVTTNYTAIETDVSLSDDLFVFQPPPGSILGEPVVLGGLAGLPRGGLVAPPPPPPPPPPKVERPADSPQRIRVDGAVQQTRLIRRVAPVYPPLARQARVQGVIRLSAIIAKDGTVQDLSLISGHPLLTPAALEAVKQWLYQPTIINNQPVEVITRIDVNFSLAE